MIAAVGGAGMGFVWGWLVVPNSQFRRPWRDVPLLLAATILMAVEILLMADQLALLLFIGSTGFSLFAHLCFYKELQYRYGPPNIGLEGI